MFPSDEQVRHEAYDRWLRRDRAHGRDGEDWLAAEQELLFRLNYRVVAHDPPGGAPRVLGDPRRRVCRFCEQAAPRASFPPGPVPAAPEPMGLASVLAFDQCVECRVYLAASIDPDLIAFAGALADGRLADGGFEPLGALKGLTRLALSLVPADDLDAFPDAIEWVLNPDLDRDSGSFEGLGGTWYHGEGLPPAPWVALARRVEDDTPMPSLLLFLGQGAGVVVLPVPLGARDEDHDGHPPIVPRVFHPEQGGGGEGRFIPLAPPARHRDRMVASR